MKKDATDFAHLDAIKNHPMSEQLNETFRTVIKETPMSKWEDENSAVEAVALNEQDLSLDSGGEFEIDLSEDGESSQESSMEEGFELSLSSDDSLELSDSEEYVESDEEVDEFSLGEVDGLEEYEEAEPSEDTMENLGELDLPVDDALDLSGQELSLTAEEELSLSGEEESDLDLSEAPSLDSLDLDGSLEEEGVSLADGDLSEDALEKLKEIDAIMDLDASQIHTPQGLTPETPEEKGEFNLSEMGLHDDLASEEVAPAVEEAEDVVEDISLNESLVSPDLDLDSLNFTGEEESEEIVAAVEEKPKKRKKDSSETSVDIGNELREISGAYSGEMERLQATISNLRSDREELLSKIQKMEEEKLLQSRQSLSMRAELDEKKIELTIIRKKLNEEINELKDRIRLYDEKRLILEEKNRILLQELDKATQKNKINIKKVQMREKELEQKLELLKSDAESQIRNRDLKILELKRKIDSMEFDMESISQQEKKSVESRFELEDKLDKAIKTLRTAITVLEDESDRSNALSALKKSIDM